MSSDDDVACAAIVAAHLLDEDGIKKRRKRRNRVNDWLLERKKKGSYVSIFNELSAVSDIFHIYMRIDLPTFTMLLEKVKPFIEKQDTVLRSSICAGARLEATLLYLISGLPYSRLQFETRISPSSLSHIIPEKCDTIYLALKDDVMKVCLKKTL